VRRRLPARLLILDEADRVLLFRFAYKRGRSLARTSRASYGTQNSQMRNYYSY
jgi:hypothetical protein